ncbi:MAG: NHLP leader peptide family RiPP precursor [Rubrobacteraceae bacterium]
MTEAGGTPEQIRQRLMQRSVEDEEFRQRLLDDPRTAIEQEIGTSLPEEVEIRTVEETQDAVYLVLPPKPQSAAEGSEISDRELVSRSPADGNQPSGTVTLATWTRTASRLARASGGPRWCRRRWLLD